MPELLTKPDITAGKTIHQVPLPGHNSMLDRDQFLFLRGQLMLADQEMAEVRNKRKKLRQHLENNGIALEELDDANRFADMESDTVLAKIQRQIQYAQWMGLPIGHQVSFFDSAAVPPAPASSLLQMAYDDGYRLGLVGQNVDKQKWLPLSPEGMRHIEGWDDGQGVLKQKFIDLNEKMAAADVAKAEAAAEKERLKAEKLAKKALPVTSVLPPANAEGATH